MSMYACVRTHLARVCVSGAVSDTGDERDMSAVGPSSIVNSRRVRTEERFAVVNTGIC